MLKDERKSEDRGVFDEGPIPVPRDILIDFFSSISFLISVDIIVTVANDNESEEQKETKETFAVGAREGTDWVTAVTVEFFSTRGREETDITSESFFTVAVIVSDGIFAEEGPEGAERTVAEELPCISITAEGHPIVVALTSDDGFLKPWTEESVVQGAERLAVDLPSISTIAEGGSRIVAWLTGTNESIAKLDRGGREAKEVPCL